MARLARGDTTALGELAERHRGRILSLSYRLLGDWHQAEDVTQDALLRLRQAAGSYAPRAKFTTWLYRIVYNLSVDQGRKTARDRVLPDAARMEGAGAAASDSAERSERARLVREAVSELSERQRRVVILHRYEGLSHAEISEVTGWSQSAVESLLVRAYGHLRKKLRKLEDSVG